MKPIPYGMTFEQALRAGYVGRIEALEAKPHNARLSGPQRPAQEVEHGPK